MDPLLIQTLHEFKMASEGSGCTAPGQDQLRYAMFRQRPDEVLKIILNLFLIRYGGKV